MTSPRDTAIAAATALIDALIAAVQPTAPPVDPPPTDPPIVPSTYHPRIMLASQAGRLRAALTAGTPPAARWKATCARWLAGDDVYGFAAWNGALLGALTTDQRYNAKAVAMIDAQVTSAAAQVAAGRQPEVAGDSYLQVGEMIGDLALVYDWCFPLLTANQKTRWIAYANQAVWNVWHFKDAQWSGRGFPWTGWSVDNPSNNYYYSFLRATMLLGLATQGESAQADAWLTMARDTKIVGQLVPTFDRDLVGGCSREGTGYGVAMRGLWELYAIWLWSTGEDLANKTAHTRGSLTTFLHQVVPSADHVALTGDLSRDSTGALFDYHRDYLQKLATLYPTAPESALAASMLKTSSVPQMGNGFMQGADFVYAPAVMSSAAEMPTVRYAPGIGQVYARSSWSKDATWMNLTAGPYTESHAHQDQGQIMIWKGGWLALDAVYWSHSGVTQEKFLVGTPGAHSLVRVDRNRVTTPQRYGSVSRVLALRTGPGYVFASLDLSQAYVGTDVTKMIRQVLWLQPDVFVIEDHVVCAPDSAPVWQLVIPAAPTIASESIADVASGGHTLRVTRVAPSSGVWSTYAFKNSPDTDFSSGWRLDQKQPGGDQRFVTVLSIDGATSLATSTVVFSEGGVSFTLDGKDVRLAAGIDKT